MPSLYEYDISYLKGVGPKRAELFKKLNAPTAGDLLRLYPRNYEDWSKAITIREAQIGELCVIKATVLSRPSEQRVKGGMLLYKVSVSDGESDMKLTFFNNKYIPRLLHEGQVYFFRGKLSGSFIAKEMSSPEFYTENKAMVILPIYPQTGGLSSRQISTAVQDAIRLLPQACTDPIPGDILAAQGLCHLNYALENIHFPMTADTMEIARRRLIFEELLVLQLGMQQMRGQNRQRSSHLIGKNYLKEFSALLPFSLTAAQNRAIEECLRDMAGEIPMNRLLQGDVGSGKTAVAAALCHTAIKNGMQCAMMAPTEILAVQHYNSLKALLEPGGIRVELFTGSITPKRKREAALRLEAGEIDLAVGTHALIREDLGFKDLGLVITDEQHRFGVEQRSALFRKGRSPHMLVMSATPIPRTLALMVYGDLDVSVLDQLPAGRQSIETYCIDSGKRVRAYKYIQKHLDEGRQAYIVCPLIDEGVSDLASVNSYFELLKEYFPPQDIAILHGKMKPKEKDLVMSEFLSGEKRLMLSTTVVEVGVDVPNAAIMLIENAERYGLSQLHQLRGRVGRGQYKSTCILLTDAQNEEARQRMKLMCSTSDGFRIADEDLRMRGPGDFFGSRQHGLPRLKIADMVKDMELLRRAQACAADILRQDPDLLEHKGLMEEVIRLFSLNDGGVVL